MHFCTSIYRIITLQKRWKKRNDWETLYRINVVNDWICNTGMLQIGTTEFKINTDDIKNDKYQIIGK